MKKYLIVRDDSLIHFNPFHDRLGKFANSPNGGLSVSKKSLAQRIRERKERNKRANVYNYRDSDNYKNVRGRYRANQTNVHNTTARLFGNKAANRIDYAVNVEGKDRRKEATKELVKQTVVGSAVAAGTIAAVYFGTKYASKGIAVLKTAKQQAYMASTMASLYGRTQGLNEIKGGFTTGFKHVKAGKKIVEMMMHAA